VISPPSRPSRLLRLGRALAALVLALALPLAGAEAQQRLLIVGMVQWTTTSRIQVMADNGQTVSVDVSRIDQSLYTGLRGGERVRVVGYVAPERNRVIAESLEVGDSSPGYWSFPQTS
jgi:outer membrane lipoprotein SlyB